MPPVPPLTLEEAAERLDMSPEEFKKRLKTHAAFKTLVPIRDGSTLRFKAAAVEELARELGAASNPELPLAPMDDALTPDSDDFKLPPAASKKGEPEPLLFAAEEDVFSLADEPKSAPKKPKSGSDSDVRLDSGKPKKPKGDEAVPTEELSIDFSGPGSAVIKGGGSSSKLSAPKSSGKLTSDSGKSLPKPAPGDSSEFELSLDADSDDFELKLNTDASDEVDLGEMPKDKDATGSGRRGGESGILSRKPNDSGPSLEKGKGKGKDVPSAAPVETDSDSDVDFELTLDSSTGVSNTKLGGAKKKVTADSDSEFELTLDDSSAGSSLEHAALGDEVEAEKGDIFETDFEIPPMDESASEAVALDPSDTDLEKSDFDVAIDDSDLAVDEESGSEVVLLEDEVAPSKKGKARPRRLTDDEVDLGEVEEEESASGAMRRAGRRRHEEEEDEEEMVPASAAAYRPVPWGPLPALVLLPTLLLTLVGALMGYELLSTMWGYTQPQKPAAPLVRALASNLDMELKDQ